MRMANGKATIVGFTLVDLLLWGGLAWAGFELWRRNVARALPGYPTVEQVGYYLIFPGVMSLVAALSGIWAYQTKSRVARFLLVAPLLALPFYLYGYGGGV